MASCSLGTLTVDLLAKTGGFQRGMDAAERQSSKTAREVERRQRKMAQKLDRIYKGIGVAAAAAFAAAVAGVHKLVDANEELYKLSKRAQGLNVGVQFLQGMAVQADDLGIKVEQLAVVFGTLNRQIATAKNGSATADKILKDFGVDPAKVTSTKEAFLAIADSVQTYGVDAKRAGELTQIFGASGKDLVPILKQGRDAIEAQNAAMVKTGEVISQTSLPRVLALHAATDSIGHSMTALRNNLLMALAPALTRVAARINSMIASMDSDKVSGFATVFGKLADAAFVVAAAFETAGKAIGAAMAVLALNGKGLVQAVTGSIMQSPEVMQAGFNKLADASGQTKAIFKDFTGDVKKEWGDLASYLASTPIAPKVLPPPESHPTQPQNGGGSVPKAKRGGAKQDKAAGSLMDSAWWQRMQREADQHARQIQAIYAKHRGAILGVSDAVLEFRDTMADANALLEDGAIDWAQYQRIADGAAKDLKGSTGKTFSTMTEYAVQAAHNMQDAFANWLIHPLQDGFKGLLKSFLQMLAKMAAQLAASKLLQSIGGSMAGSSTGWVSAIGTAIQAYGQRANGGPVAGGTTYMVGERGPELFTPNASGHITPNHAMGGGGSVTVNQTFNIAGSATRGTESTAGQQSAAVKAFHKRMKDVALKTIQDEQRPGGSLWRMAHG